MFGNQPHIGLFFYKLLNFDAVGSISQTFLAVQFINKLFLQYFMINHVLNWLAVYFGISILLDAEVSSFDSKPLSWQSTPIFFYSLCKPNSPIITLMNLFLQQIVLFFISVFVGGHSFEKHRLGILYRLLDAPWFMGRSIGFPTSFDKPSSFNHLDNL